jgi:hypothetical protein
MSGGTRRSAFRDWLALAAAMTMAAAFAVVGGPALVLTARAQDSSSAPAPAASAPAADVDQLRERAAAFWAARVAGDPKGQWELLEPRGRGRVTPAEYASVRGAVKYLAYQVEDATVDGYFGTVKVRLLVQILPPSVQQRRKIPPSGTLVSDRWVRVGGIWYRSVEQPQDELAEPRPQ